MMSKPHIRLVDGEYFCSTEYFGGVGSTPTFAYVGWLEAWYAPRHAAGCSNQNVLDPLGAYRGIEQCGGCSSASK